MANTSDKQNTHKKRLKQQNKILLYFFTGDIPFCMCLHAVRTFLVDVIDNSWIPSLYWPVLHLKALQKLLAMSPGYNLWLLHFLLFISIFFSFCYSLWQLVWCPECTGLLLSDLSAAEKSHNKCLMTNNKTVTHTTYTHNCKQQKAANQLLKPDKRTFYLY